MRFILNVLTHALKPVPFKDGALLFLELLSNKFAVISFHRRGMEITVNGVCGLFRKSNRWASPGFPVKLVDVGQVHAAFLNESRTRGRVQCSLQEIRVAHLFGSYAPRRTWGTRPEGKACREAWDWVLNGQGKLDKAGVPRKEITRALFYLRGTAKLCLSSIPQVPFFHQRNSRSLRFGPTARRGRRDDKVYGGGSPGHGGSGWTERRAPNRLPEKANSDRRAKNDPTDKLTNSALYLKEKE